MTTIGNRTLESEGSDKRTIDQRFVEVGDGARRSETSAEKCLSSVGWTVTLANRMVLSAEASPRMAGSERTSKSS